jgi:hypothetical protein
VTYLDEFLAGYRQGLAGSPPQPIQALRAALAEAADPRQRGALLGLLANALAVGAGKHYSIKVTASRPLSITHPVEWVE